MACLLALSTPSTSSTSILVFDQSTLAATLEEARREMEMPGLRASVRFPDGRVIRAAAGLADVEEDIPLDNHIGMPGGSTGKTFAATLAMLLVEDGKLSLDDLAAKWLGDRPWYARLPNADAMRIHHLLSHSSGIADYPGTVRFNLSLAWRVIRHGSARFTPEELIGFVLGRKAPFAPGEGFLYTDAGYLVLGRVMEAAAGRPYYALLEERVLRPLGLDGIRPADRSILEGIATGYTAGARNRKKDGRMKFDPSSEWTGGGLVTTPAMLVEFFAALAEGRIVSPGSFEAMLNHGWRGSHNEPWSHYGLGVFVYEAGESFGHAGLWPGYRTNVTHFLASGVTVAVQTNRDGQMDLEGLLRRIAAQAEASIRR